MRSATFNDHYSQARQFFDSQTGPEQDHIVAALIFVLSKVEADVVRAAMLGHLVNIKPELGERVAAGLGHDEPIVPIPQAVPTRTDLAPSPALRILANAKPTLQGRKIGLLVTDGADAALVAAIVDAATAAKATVEVVAPKVGGATLSDGTKLAAKHQLAGGPSLLFDAVALAVSADGVTALLGESAAVAWVHDAFAHLKVIGHSADSQPLLDTAGVMADAGVIAITGADAAAFIDTAANGRIWARDENVRTVF